MKFKFLEHTADVKFQAFGKSLEDAFVNAGLALKEVIAGKIMVGKKIKKKIKIKGKDKEGLLYNFLEEFLFLLDSEGFLVSGIQKLAITPTKLNNKLIINKKLNKRAGAGKYKNEGFQLTAVLVGDKAGNYKFTNDAKAITYNQMFVKGGKGKWVCQVVVDV